MKNSMLLIEEKITNLERVKRSRSFSGGISDDEDMSNDLIYVFACGDMNRDLFKFVRDKLKRDCSVIEGKSMLAVRIRVS